MSYFVPLSTAATEAASWSKKEWLETDGLGGYAMGCGDGIPRRRYHTLLTVAMSPPVRRTVMVNGVEVFLTVTFEAGNVAKYPLSSFQFPGPVFHPNGKSFLSSFTETPWPQWHFYLSDHLSIYSEMFMTKGAPITVMRWWPEIKKDSPTIASLSLQIRPFFSCRNHHGLHHKNDQLSFQAQNTPRGVLWKPYLSMPEIAVLTTAEYVHDHLWFERVSYEFDEARGFEAKEDLASPGYVKSELLPQGISLAFTVPQLIPDNFILDGDATSICQQLRKQELERRNTFTDKWERAADAYIVSRGERKSIIAGYPWFSDWGRDTFIAIRGLCISCHRWRDTTDILLEWQQAISAGMIPNLFPEESDGRPLYNSIDGSLWFVIAAYEFISSAPKAARSEDEYKIICQSIKEIIDGYSKGTRFNIRLDSDGLLQGGITGTQLTWMDAKVGALVVTPRIGKTVEVQALWLNALYILETLGDSSYQEIRIKGEKSFAEKFWNNAQQELYDVIDVDYQIGVNDPTSRPNQIFAIGGLPFQILKGEQASRVVAKIEQNLLTPHGLRTLDPSDSRFTPIYSGGPFERDRAYHQGTVWPWLLGAFIEAWLRVREDSELVKREAINRFIIPLQESIMVQYGGHIAEIADATSPFLPRGSPCQAWSLAELIRLRVRLGLSKR
jgi:predicted glycogen debranching enzyme